MASTTPILGLKKPGTTEYYNIADDNGNMDLIDAAVGVRILKSEISELLMGARNINLVNGGELRWGIVANTFSWSKIMSIYPAGGKLLVGGVVIRSINIAIGTAVLANAGDCMYITIPATDGATAPVAVAQFNAITGTDKLILAVRDSDACLELLGGGWITYGTIVEAGGKRDNYIPKSIVTAANDFIVGSGNNAVAKKTLAETKTILGISTLDTLPITAGTAPTFTATQTDFTLVAGRRITVKFHVVSAAVSTLNVNALGAKGLKKPDGTDITNIKAGVYTFVYDGTSFIVQGEGASGNAVASDLLSGKTASTDAGEITGTMANRAGDNAAIANSVSGITLKLRPPSGFFDGVDDNVTITDADFIAANIKAGVDLFGLAGTLPLGKRIAVFKPVKQAYTFAIGRTITVAHGLAWTPSIIFAFTDCTEDTSVSGNQFAGLRVINGADYGNKLGTNNPGNTSLNNYHVYNITHDGTNITCYLYNLYPEGNTRNLSPIFVCIE